MQWEVKKPEDKILGDPAARALFSGDGFGPMISENGQWSLVLVVTD